LDAMTALLEAHGQGGSGHLHLDWPYHNAFLIADPAEAWVLETSGRHWAAKPVGVVANISNGLAIRADWTRGSADLTTFAVERGWWQASGGTAAVPAAYTRERGGSAHQAVDARPRAAAFLAEHRGQLVPSAMRTLLRDHYDAGSVHRPRPFDDPFFFSICMHADPLDNTTASMVAPLPADPDAVAAIAVSLGSP